MTDRLIQPSLSIPAPVFRPARPLSPLLFQNISRCRPSVDMTLLAISSMEVCVVLSVGMRSIWNMASAAATSCLQVSSYA